MQLAQNKRSESLLIAEFCDLFETRRPFPDTRDPASDLPAFARYSLAVLALTQEGRDQGQTTCLEPARLSGRNQRANRLELNDAPFSSHGIARERSSLKPLASSLQNSNRQTPPELKTRVTHTKQTPGPVSNRQCFALFPKSCFLIPSRPRPGPTPLTNRPIPVKNVCF